MKTVNINQSNIIEPIEWTQYTGETVIVKTIIRKGQRIQETQFYEDKVKAVHQGNAYIIGNGPSRKGFDLNLLKSLYIPTCARSNMKAEHCIEIKFSLPIIVHQNFGMVTQKVYLFLHFLCRLFLQGFIPFP